MKSLRFFIVFSIVFASICSVSSLQNDPSGYVLFCPCMGRFGNQVDQYLGALGFAKSVNRTLVLPPWVEYHLGISKSVQIPFVNYFKIEPIQEYHRVVTMEEFMDELAPKVWPPGERKVFCYAPFAETGRKGCRAKDGNPFRSFWDTYKIDFDSAEYHSPLYYTAEDPDDTHIATRWLVKYPPHRFPVLAFSGAPALFPMDKNHVSLHTHFVWSDDIQKKAQAFIDDNLKGMVFVGIHLRNGIDWESACELVTENANTPSHLFSSAQCSGYEFEGGLMTYDMCLPSKETVLKEVDEAVRRINAEGLFIASDHDHMMEEFHELFSDREIEIVRLDYPADPHEDLAILAQAHHYIGNCISSFSAFAKRERDVANKTSSFWSFKPGHPYKPHNKLHHDL